MRYNYFFLILISVISYSNALWAAAGSCTSLGPSGCRNVGDQCTDGTIFAGYHPTLNKAVYVQPSDQSTGAAWSTVTINTGADDLLDGRVNQAWVKTNTTITDYPAFKLCDDLNTAVSLGHNDWYLPSRDEMFYLWTIHGTIDAGPGDGFTNANYWTSSEILTSPITDAWDIQINYGTVNVNPKTTTTRRVRCMRRD